MELNNQSQQVIPVVMSNTTQNNIYRYKFDKNFTDKVYDFSKENKNLNKEQFKDNWDRWKVSNETLINSEVERLKTIGCTGDIENKMFRSSRYYFSKKNEKEPKQRRKYVSLDRDFIEIVDNHILLQFANTNTISSPKDCYKNFCEHNVSNIDTEINRMFEDDNFDKDEGSKKIKKAYKNRYYLLSQKTENS